MNSRGVFEEISSDNPYRDYILACRILMWDLYDSKKPVERGSSYHNNLHCGDCYGATFLCEAGSFSPRRGLVHSMRTLSTIQRVGEYV